MACFPSLTQYIGETPPSLKLDEMCMKLIFISICTYLCGVCPIYCWFSNSLVPMSLGTILFVLLFQEQLEMHWTLGSLTRKVVSSCANWSQARMINELLPTFNWYLPHPSNDISVTSISSCILFLHSTLCRLHLCMIFIPSCDTCFLSQSISMMILCC